MAVATASATAGSTEPAQQMGPSPSNLASADSDSSLSSSAAAFVRTDSISSPKSRKDAETQSPDISKSEEYRHLFRLPPEEVLVEDFNCALQENLLIQGHMYLFVQFICFYSNIFGFETKKVIPFHEVTSVRRAKTAGLFHNAIEIFAGGRKYFFASFLSRDEAFKIINDRWSQQKVGARAITEQQELISESSSQENGLIAIDKVKSSETLDSALLSTDLTNDTSTCKDVGIPSQVEGGPVLMTDSEQQSSTEPVLNNDASRITWVWKEEDIDAPKTPEVYTAVAESKFPIKVEDFFRYFFSDDAVNFLESFRKRCGDKDVKCTSWQPQELGYTREVSFQHPIKLYLGAKFGACHDVQKYRVYRNSHLVMETSQEVSDVPYADYFRVEGLWDVEKNRDESKECCILHVYVNVSFSKKTIWKGKIVQATIEECREAFAMWIDMAHELLKQMNLEKQEESVAATSVTEKGKVNLDREAKTGESSERSMKSSNPTSLQAICDVVDLNRNDRSHLQVSSLLREFTAKFGSSLKSHSHLSLFLIIIFAVIFFMQFSILLLLARPQHIHVSSPADYMNRIENEVGRSSSDVAWLEKRIHHLKDEMYMVEGRLERMRYEHALLKKQLEDLERR